MLTSKGPSPVGYTTVFSVPRSSWPTRSLSCCSCWRRFPLVTWWWTSCRHGQSSFGMEHSSLGVTHFCHWLWQPSSLRPCVCHVSEGLISVMLKMSTVAWSTTTTTTPPPYYRSFELKITPHCDWCKEEFLISGSGSTLLWTGQNLWH